MSKRAEEAALQRYALKEVTPMNVKLHDEFKAGYEQAEKDTIERIIGYLGERDLEHTILGFDIDGYAYIDFECLEKLIHKTMEEE